MLILYRNQIEYLKSKLCFENYFRPVSIANCVQAVLLRAAQLRIVGLEAAFAEVPLDEEGLIVQNICNLLNNI